MKKAKPGAHGAVGHLTTVSTFYTAAPRRASRQALVVQDARPSTPERRLALAVIAQAVDDVKAGKFQDEVLQFFGGDQDESLLDFWCELAEVHPDRVRERVASLLAAKRRRS